MSPSLYFFHFFVALTGLVTILLFKGSLKLKCYCFATVAIITCRRILININTQSSQLYLRLPLLRFDKRTDFYLNKTVHDRSYLIRRKKIQHKQGRLHLNLLFYDLLMVCGYFHSKYIFVFK